MSSLTVRWLGDQPDFDAVEMFTKRRGMAMSMSNEYSRILCVLEHGASTSYLVHVSKGEFTVEGTTGRERYFTANFIQRYGGSLVDE